MAKFESFMDIKGSIGDLVFYKLNGVNVVRRKSGFNKESFETNPNYAKVKQNSSEFGHASKSGKMIREALSDYVGDCGDKLMYQKFAKVMTQVKDMDTTSERGNRKIQIGLKNEESQKILKNFAFGEIPNVTSVATKMEGFFTDSVSLTKTGFDEIELITLKPDFENYTIEKKSQKFSIKGKQNTFEFDWQFPDEGLLLYFLVLKKKDIISNIGFV